MTDPARPPDTAPAEAPAAEPGLPAPPHDRSNALKAPRLDKLEALRAAGHDPYPYRFDKTDDAAALHDRYADLPMDTGTGDVTRVAGRIRAMRNNGMFIDLHDPSGKIQVFSHKDTLSEAGLTVLGWLDLGDLIGVEGRIRRTRRGELTVDAQAVSVLAKALLPLPEKYHGLTDVEARYRQRYLDLIMNEESRATLRARSRIVAAIRTFMVERGYLEVETPMLQPQPSGAAARPFVTRHNALDLDLYLRIAPELYLKRLVVGGLAERVFEINRNFRNEGISPRHNPEFTMMEFYAAYQDYTDMMAMTEGLFAAAAVAATGGTRVRFGEHAIEFAGPYPRRSMIDLVREASGIDFAGIADATEARAAAAGLGCEVRGRESWGQAVELAFERTVEASLIQPTHVTDFPRDISPLAKAHRHDPRLTERYETFCNGWEVANAFSELTDPQDQHERFLAQAAARAAGDEEVPPMDSDYVTALEYGLPPCGGQGVGVDRLVMLLTDSPSIRDVIAFPTLRPRRDYRATSPDAESAPARSPARPA